MDFKPQLEGYDFKLGVQTSLRVSKGGFKAELGSQIVGFKPWSAFQKQSPGLKLGFLLVRNLVQSSS